jgi:8-oxo-dGTP pyrophosphatase MutT (NUDIX family)
MTKSPEGSMRIRNRLIGAALRPLWRVRRGLTLGAQACVIDDRQRVLLVQHGYRPGWHFPGGGVEWGETAATAMQRELMEETGVELTGQAELHGIFANFANFPGDHIVLYVVRHWRRPTIPAPNAEIVASGFYPADALPATTVAGARRRVGEILGSAQPATNW